MLFERYVLRVLHYALIISCLVFPISSFANPPQGMLAETIRDCIDLGCGCNVPGPGQCGCGKQLDECGVCEGPGKTGCDHQCGSTATVDECGLCGGPGRTGCDLQCGSTKVADACGECGGSNTSCSCVHPIYEVSVTRIKYGRISRSERDGVPILTGDRPNCLEQIWKQCNVTGNFVVGMERRHYMVATGGRGSSIQPKGNSSGDDCMTNYFLREEEKPYQWDGSKEYHFPPRYVNDSCQLVDYPGYTCGTFSVTAMTSPISLVWKKGVSHKSRISMSQFPLNPAKQGKWHLWYASGDTPLLVFDPQHEGSVKSAEQLFGNFTFGKQWKNGYEALQFLDQDQNGILKEAELDPLSLWFDYNQDGVSQEGEVRRLQQLAVSEVYVTPDSAGQFEVVPSAIHEFAERPRDVHAAKGYKRIRDGIEEILPSVDWFALSSDSREELLVEIQRTLSKDQADTKNHSKSSARNVAASTAQAGSDIVGTWKWHFNKDSKSPGGPQPRGMLTFNEVNGEIRGLSYMELPVKDNVDEVKSAIHIFPVKGTREVGIDGKTRISFEVTSGEGVVTRSTAILDSKGTALSGNSSVVTGSEGEFKYRWIAKKMS